MGFCKCFMNQWPQFSDVRHRYLAQIGYTTRIVVPVSLRIPKTELIQLINICRFFRITKKVVQIGAEPGVA